MINGATCVLFDASFILPEVHACMCSTFAIQQLHYVSHVQQSCFVCTVLLPHPLCDVLLPRLVCGVQLLHALRCTTGISGSFLSKLLSDVMTNKLKENEVSRAIELRNIVTSLGPAYIKLGQALSIRPDLLSPAAMNELQKLCDKVPSFDSRIAMQVRSTLDNNEREWRTLVSCLSCGTLENFSTLLV